MKAATKVRETEKNDYMVTHQDYTESIDALHMAITVLSKEAYDRKQAAAALTQVKEALFVPEQSKKVIDAFLAQDPDMKLDLAEEYAQRVSAPEANAFEFHSQGVVDMMQKLKDKFQDERTQLEKDEASSRHNFQMLMQDLQSQSASAEEARGSKATAKAKKLQAVADTRADLQ